MSEAPFWKDIPGWEGIYQVSSTGLVKSLDRKIYVRGVERHVSGRVLSAGTTTNGYPYVHLSGRGKHVVARIHRLMAEAFLGEAPFENAEVNHKDGCKSNNLLENLEWVTKSQNALHSYQTLHNKGPKRKLSTAQVSSILSNGRPQHLIAAEYGVTQMTISKIKRGLTYKEVIR